MSTFDERELVAVIRQTWDAIDRGAGLDAEYTPWRRVRFIGRRSEGEALVHGRDSRPSPEWLRAALRELGADRLPRTCLPVVYREGDQWRAVHPSRIDWTGYRHAGGDPERRARRGSAGSPTPEGERGTVQVNARVPRAVREAYEREAERRGVSLGTLVRERLTGADWVDD